jgi:hypothetical protein
MNRERMCPTSDPDACPTFAKRLTSLSEAGGVAIPAGFEPATL